MTRSRPLPDAVIRKGAAAEGRSSAQSRFGALAGAEGKACASQQEHPAQRGDGGRLRHGRRCGRHAIEFESAVRPRLRVLRVQRLAIRKKADELEHAVVVGSGRRPDLLQVRPGDVDGVVAEKVTVCDELEAPSTDAGPGVEEGDGAGNVESLDHSPGDRSEEGIHRAECSPTHGETVWRVNVLDVAAGDSDRTRLKGI